MPAKGVGLSMKNFVLSLLSICFFSNAHADWPQFRGVDSAGKSDAKLPTEWNDEKNILWKLQINGKGSSSPIVSGHFVFVTSYTGEGDSLQRHLTKIDVANGKEVWKKSVDIGFPEDPARGYIMEHGWASNTPATDGESVFCYYGKAGVYAYDFDGNELWNAKTGSLSSQKQWGSASSPILYKDLLIVPAGDEKRAIIAFNKKDGKQTWIAEGESMEQTYGSPLVVEVDENRTDIVFASTAEWWGLNPDTGKLRWFAEYNLPGNMSNTTVRTGDILTISGGFPRTARGSGQSRIKG